MSDKNGLEILGHSVESRKKRGYRTALLVILIVVVFVLGLVVGGMVS